jgi:hypothetical protein
MSFTYTVITWDNAGNRFEAGSATTLAGALMVAKGQRTTANRTVKIGHCGDSIRHWSRTITAKKNHWATHSTAECSR